MFAFIEEWYYNSNTVLRAAPNCIGGRNMEERKQLTKEQRNFYLALKKIHSLESQENPDVTQIKKLKLFLWDQIKYFARDEMKRMIGRFSTYEERLEVEQDMALIFFEKLPYYDPLRSTPTTYFVRYFREKISKFIRTYKVHMTQYDTTNARAINAAIAEYSKNGIPYTLDMLSTKTGLSQRVIKSTIQHSANAKRANIDDEEYCLHADIPTPEDAYIQSENEHALADAIVRNTSELERELLFMRVNADGRKEMPFDQIAEITGLSIRDVKAIINNAICKLNQDTALQKQFGNHNQYRFEVEPLSIQDGATDIMQQQMEDFISGQ